MTPFAPGPGAAGGGVVTHGRMKAPVSPSPGIPNDSESGGNLLAPEHMNAPRTGDKTLVHASRNLQVISQAR
jgi:hypothetical protein